MDYLLKPRAGGGALNERHPNQPANPVRRGAGEQRRHDGGDAARHVPEGVRFCAEGRGVFLGCELQQAHARGHRHGDRLRHRIRHELERVGVVRGVLDRDALGRAVVA